MERRSFCRTLTLAAGGGAVVLSGAALTGCAGVATHRAELTNGRLGITEVRFRELAGERRAVALAAPGLTHPVLLLAREDETFHAVSGECTHQSCTIRPGKDFLVCPCHGSTFDRHGRVLRGPAREPLAAFPVRVANGWIDVEVNA